MNHPFYLLLIVLPLSSCQSMGEPFGTDDDSWELRVAEAALPGVIRVVSAGGNAGSGFFIHPSGLAITNDHVVAGQSSGDVQLVEGEKAGPYARYEVIARGASRDLALLQVHLPGPVSHLPLGRSSDLPLGSSLMAIGSPQGMFPVVTTGVLGGRLNPGSIGPLMVPEQLLHSAPTLRGSSGCPILSDRGAVIGVQSAKPSMELVKVTDGVGEEGASFDRGLNRWKFQTEGFGLAIPVEDIRSFAPHWIAPEWSTGLESGFGCDLLRTGCFVSSVVGGSPASLAGLSVGDQIQRANGNQVFSPVDLCVWMLHKNPLTLAVLRGGSKLELSFDRTPWPVPEASELIDGLMWRETTGVRARLDDFPAGSSSTHGVVGGVRLPSTHNGADGFTLELSGWIDVPAAGHWSFELSSDDGSQLYLRDKLLIDNDGLHGKVGMRVELDLEAGLHPIRIVYFEARGDEALEAKWASDGEELQLIPDAALFHRTGLGW